MVWAVTRNRQVLAGVLLGLSTTIKPQLSGPLLLFYFLRPAFKTALIATGITALATVVGVAKLAIDHVTWIPKLRAAMAIVSKPGAFNDASRLNASSWQMVNLQYLLFGFLHNRTLVNTIAAAVTLILSALFVVVWRQIAIVGGGPPS